MKSLLTIAFGIFCSLTWGQNFIEMVKAVSSDRAEDDRLGYAVTIDGDWAAVGAYGDDFGGSNPNMGSVYIFEQQGLNNWVQVQKLIASDQDDYDRFGWSVDIHGDLLVVGAYGADEDTLDANSLTKAGAAYIFKNINGTWTEMQILNASDRDADDEFGWSVTIFDSTAIIGAHIEDHDELGNNFMYHSGSVYAFELGTNNVWSETQKIVAEDRWVDMNYPNGYSGEDLADQFGGSVSLWGDWMIVGAHHHDYATIAPNTGALWSSGAAYIFERTAGTWNQVAKIQNSDREGWDRFGYAVDIDTNVIAVCAYSEDEDENGNNALTNPGSVYLFERDPGGTWSEVQKIVPDDRSSGDHFGYSIDIDDSLMVLGCHSDDHDEFGSDLKADAGSAYIFEKNGGVWSQFQKIDASDRAIDDDFGISVGVSGYTVLVGAQYQDFNAVGADSLEDAGAAYFYSNFICPLIDTTVDVSICDGNTYDIGSSSYTSSGSYTDVLVSVAGCDSTVHSNLTVNPDISTDIYPSMCDGGIYYYNSIGITVPGNYSYLYTANNGCDSTVIVHLSMDAPITSEQWVTICWGESYSIGLNTYTNSGTYQDVVSATNFCDSTITTHLSVELPLDMSITQNASTLTSNEIGDSYLWFNCANNQPMIGGTNQVYNAIAIGSYGVIVTKNGCSDTSACVYVSEIVSINEINTNDSYFTLFPNPSNGSFNLLVNNNLNNPIIRIYNPTGQIVLERTLKANSASFNLDSPGLYIVELQNNNVVSHQRIVIK